MIVVLLAMLLVILWVPLAAQKIGFTVLIGAWLIGLGVRWWRRRER